MNQPTVTSEVATSIQVGRFLKEIGLLPANGYGQVVESIEETNSIDVIYRDPELKPKKRSWLAEFFTEGESEQPLGINIGTISFGTEESPDTWTWEYRGSEQTSRVEQAAKKIAEKFGMNVKIRLVNEEELEEVAA